MKSPSNEIVLRTYTTTVLAGSKMTVMAMAVIPSSMIKKNDSKSIGKQLQQQQILSHHQHSIPHHISQRIHHFLFGYGSLINTCSRSRSMTSHHATESIAIPALVKGYHRSWSYLEHRKQYTAVGVDPDPHSIVNGVLVHLSAQDPISDLARLDEREKNYIRTPVPLESLELLPISKHYSSSSTRLRSRQRRHASSMESLLRAARSGSVIVWIYVNAPTNHSQISLASSNSQEHHIHHTRHTCDATCAVSSTHHPNTKDTSSSMNLQQPSSPDSFPPSLQQSSSHTPCKKYPIPQTYIDCILKGCLQYGHDFTLLFLKTTSGWQSGYWLNDRMLPSHRQKYVCREDLGEEKVIHGQRDAELIDSFLRRVGVCLETRRVDIAGFS